MVWNVSGIGAALIQVGGGDLPEDVVELAALDEDLIDGQGLLADGGGYVGDDAGAVPGPVLGDGPELQAAVLDTDRLDLLDAGQPRQRAPHRLGLVAGDADGNGP